MGSRSSLFPSGVASSRTTPVAADAGEIDLREEFDSIINGGNGEIPKGTWFILRKMRRDSDGVITICPVCTEDGTKEPTRDYPCPYCLGSGYLWDEEWVKGYKVTITAPAGATAKANLVKHDIGEIYMPGARFWLPWDTVVTRRDRLTEVELDKEGNIIQPLNRLNNYEIELLRDLRGDYGRVEFIVCHCQILGPETQGYVG